MAYRSMVRPGSGFYTTDGLLTMTDLDNDDNDVEMDE